MPKVNCAKVSDIIKQYSNEPAFFQIKFLQRVIFNYLIGNADAHGKNFALLYKTKKPTLAPNYDILSTEVYPNLSKKMAMRIAKKYNPEEVLLNHWHSLVLNTKTAKKNFNKQLQNTIKDCLEKSITLKKELENLNIKSLIFEKISLVIANKAKHILKEL